MFLGIEEDLFSPRFCLVSPWMTYGHVIGYLEQNPEHNRLLCVRFNPGLLLTAHLTDICNRLLRLWTVCNIYITLPLQWYTVT